jgi:hypothetical protein
MAILNEQFRRMQKLAGIITEEQLNEDINDVLTAGGFDPIDDEDLLEKANGGTPEQEKIKKVVDQYVNLRKAIDDPNYPDTPHTYSTMKKVENILNQMSRKENYRIFLLKILPTQYQDFLK